MWHLLMFGNEWPDTSVAWLLLQYAVRPVLCERHKPLLIKSATPRTLMSYMLVVVLRVMSLARPARCSGHSEINCTSRIWSFVITPQRCPTDWGGHYPEKRCKRTTVISVVLSQSGNLLRA